MADKSHLMSGMISSDKFFDAMRRIDTDLPHQLRNLLDKLENFDVRPEFRKSMILRCATLGSNKSVQLGYVQLDGFAIFHDVAKSLSDHSGAAMCFLNAIADAYDFKVGVWANGKKLLTNRDELPKIVQIVQQPDDFVLAVEDLVKRIRG